MNSGESTQVAKSTPEHCAFCFDVVAGIVNKKFSKKDCPPPPQSIPNIVAPLFVTWHKDGDLRGCIGTFAKESIAKNLPQYAAVSAFEDTRFDPISKDELPKLTCAVSLLTDFEKGNDAYDWEIGKHGITIEARLNGFPYRGTFLPEVAKEQGWSKEETLKFLVRKAGFRGSLPEIIDHIQLERYQSSKCEISYNDYLNMRKSA